MAPAAGAALTGTPASPAEAPTATSPDDPLRVDDGAANDTSTGDATNGSAGANATAVTVLTYNDVQTAAAQDGDFPRLVTLIERRRAVHENPTAVAGAGPDRPARAVAGEPVARAGERTRRGRSRRRGDRQPRVRPRVRRGRQRDRGLRVPVLATNVVNNSTEETLDGTEKYTIVEHDGVRIGFVGPVDREATYGETNVDFAGGGVAVRDLSEVGPEAASYLKDRKSVDVAVALAHTGVPEAKAIARADDGEIDVFADCTTSNSAHPDTDGERLSDTKEVRVYGTDPLDVDGDGVSDCREVNVFGTALTDADDAPAEA